MKVLLLHPEDTPREGPWAEFSWDLVVDLGWAGRYAYDRWSQRFGCPVLSLFDFAEEVEDLRQVKSILDVGRGRLIDSEGLDWWELWSPDVLPGLPTLLMLSRLSEHLKRARDIAASRPSHDVRILSLLLGTQISRFSSGMELHLCHRLRHYTRLASNSSFPRLMEIALDKWDPSYALRRLVAARGRRISAEPVILLPSAYVNVSRVVMEYANMLPHRRFLLVTTRRSGRLVARPSNVTLASLASYAFPASSSRQELVLLVNAWRLLRQKVITQVKELALAHKVGLFNDYPALLRRGLAIRDAWRQLFDREVIDGVLCGDENNLYTRIPVILGKRKGVPTVRCHHGALDAYMLLGDVASRIYLVKGEMEKDYLMRICGLSSYRIAVGAPNRGPRSARARTRLHGSQASSIVFFSEPYECHLGRVEEAYRELLPRLCAVARRTGRKVIVKLHPFESQQGRAKLVKSILSAGDRQLVEIIDAPLSTELLEKTWFGVTVESSVAVECTLQSVPCFLCGWLERVGYAYEKQYAKFGAGYVLDSPDDIEHIPELLRKFSITPDMQQRLWQPITAQELDRLLSGYV